MTWKPGNRVSVWDRQRLGRVRKVEGNLVLVEITDGGNDGTDDPPAGYAAWWPADELDDVADPEPERTDPRGARSSDARPFAQSPVPDVPTSHLRRSHTEET